jgi:hypothetical protein
MDPENCNAEKYFLGFTKIVNFTSESLTNTIINLLKRENLDIAFLHEQGCKRGANMRGAFEKYTQKF